MKTITDHRTLPRRRGSVLEEAILDAALSELTEVGYPNLTMERVATRARASKASVYSRWPSRMELVMDVFYHLMPDPGSPPDTGTLRGDLIASFRQTARLLAGPAGEAIRGLLADVLPDTAQTDELRRHSHQLGRQTMEEIARRAVARGEIAADAVTALRIEVGPAMLRYHFLFHGLVVPDAVITAIVDEVIIPLLNAEQPRDSR
jgi:AcrR family transcriptional regulator